MISRVRKFQGINKLYMAAVHVEVKGVLTKDFNI